MHKSIFLTIKDYKSDPITEMKKIDNILQKECGYYTTIYNVLTRNFVKSKELRVRFVDLDECISSLIPFISDNYNCFDFQSLSTVIQKNIYDEFFDYCETIIHLLSISYESAEHEIEDFDNDTYMQAVESIIYSLKSLNYKIDYLDEKKQTFQVIKINPEAEIVAAQSEITIKQSIIHYLGARDNDLEEKENRLHKIIDLLELSFKKYTNDNNVKKIREYIQLIRHPKTYENRPEYKWFYDEKDKYLDELFSLCIYVQHLVIMKEIVNNLDELKKESSECN